MSSQVDPPGAVTVAWINFGSGHYCNCNPDLTVGLPHQQKNRREIISGSRKRNADEFGPETLEKQGREIGWKNLPSKFAEKFAGNFPKIRQAIIIQVFFSTTLSVKWRAPL